MSNMPSGWTECLLEDIGSWSSGGTPSRTRPDYFGGGIPWIKSGDLPDGPILNVTETISAAGLETSAAKMLPPNTICMALYGATIGKLGITTFDACTNQATANVIVNGHLADTKFVFHYLRSKRTDFISAGKGGAQPNISQQIVRSTPIRIAPLNEQKRIADKLDSLLGRVDACRERLDRIPTILKRLRQSILASACSGQLTADWREEHPNLERSESLATRIASERFDLWCDAMHRKAKADGRQLTGTAWKDRYEEPCEINLNKLPQLPSNWMWKSFDSFTAQFQYGPRFGEGEYTEADNGIPTVRTSDMNFRGEITLKNPPRVVVADDALDHFILLPDDMVITRTGATIGKCALYSSALGPAIASAYLIRYRLTKNTTIPRFVLTVLMSPWGQENLLGGMKAVAQPNINTTTISKIPVPIPPVAEQIEIVRRVESLLAIADIVERKLDAGLSALSRFVPSVLSKAFRGELVNQDTNDEPAAALLKRIQDLRESVPTKKKTERSKSKQRVPKTKAAMTKSRHDDDVRSQPYLATLIKKAKKPISAEDLFKKADLPLADFYKQLDFEVKQNMIVDRDGMLEFA